MTAPLHQHPLHTVEDKAGHHRRAAATRTRLVALAFIVALVAASCGGSESASTDDATSSDAAASTPGTTDDSDDTADTAVTAGTAAAATPVAGDETDDPQDASDGGDDAPAMADGTGPADDSLEPIRIGLMNQENDPVGSFPELRIGIEGAAAYINAELGGIDGHPIELVSCVQNSVEKAQECAQELASDNLVSVINGINIWTIGFDFYATMGDTPVIGGLPLFPADYDQPNARYFNGGSIGVYAAMARFAAEELGAQKVAVLLNANPAASAAVKGGLAPIFGQFGVTYTEINVPLPLTDAIAPVSLAAAEEADIVMLLASGGECVPIIRAADQLGIAPETMLYSATCAEAEIYAEVGELMVGSWIARGGYTRQDPWAPAEVLALFDDSDRQLETYAPDAPDAPFTGLGWATMLDLHDLLEEVGIDNLNDPANIIAVVDDGATRGRPGGFGWACVYADIELQSICQGNNLFVEIIDADGTSAPPPNDGAYVDGLALLEAS